MKCHNVMSTTKLGKSYNLSYTATYITFPPQIVLQRIEVTTSGAVTLVFPKAPHVEIVWVGVGLGFAHFHVCGHTPINCPRGRKTLNPV